MAVLSDPSCACGCTDPRGHAVHPVSRALASGDLDRAFALGLLDLASCPACPPDCVAGLEGVQDERRQALAARDRYRQREARLERQRVEREQRRMTGVGTAGTRNGPLGASTPVRAAPPALPAAAAAALARAQAKAAKP